MGAASCSSPAVPDPPGEPAKAEISYAGDGDGPFNALVAPSAPKLEPSQNDEIGPFPTDGNNTVVATEQTAIEERSAVEAKVSDAEATDRVDKVVCGNEAKVVPGGATVPICSPSSSPGSLPSGPVASNAKKATPAASPPVVPIITYSATALTGKEEEVPPLILLSRVAQAERRANAAAAEANATRQPTVADSKEDIGQPVETASAFLDVMGSGNEGHQYDRSEITRLAAEMETMHDPRSFYHKSISGDGTAEAAPSKKSDIGKTKGSKKVAKKQADTRTAEASEGHSAKSTVRKDRLPGCSVRADLAKHMTQEELDAHEEAREKWVKSEMRKSDQRQEIMNRLKGEQQCQQQ